MPDPYGTRLPPLSPPPGADAEGGYDEARLDSGQPREVWRALLTHLQSTPELLGQLGEEAGRLLRESGVTYNVFDAHRGGRQIWPFDPVPLILDGAQWRDLEYGIRQRHRLLTLLFRDLHGPRQTLSQGLLPPDLFFSRPGISLARFPGVGAAVTPLSLYGVDLIRAPDGRHLAVSDRVQAPSGLGYVLQNRRITNRVYADSGLFNRVPTLLPFFRQMRSGLVSLSPYSKANAHAVLLTPGPANETYYEHALLAHFLGLTLVQGDDLTVRSGRVCLKTLHGLMPVEVILRRVDEAWCDPLEQREDSLLGVVGLTHAQRTGRVALANALGSGVLENLALHAYLPHLAEALLGEPLALESPATWWLGDAAQRRAVANRLGDLDLLPVGDALGLVVADG
ncbi:MAG: circularly permuted type 2 ATP-grasp protein, partial [Magnetococcus sp. WYHC-3]